MAAQKRKQNRTPTPNRSAERPRLRTKKEVAQSGKNRPGHQPSRLLNYLSDHLPNHLPHRLPGHLPDQLRRRTRCGHAGPQRRAPPSHMPLFLGATYAALLIATSSRAASSASINAMRCAAKPFAAGLHQTTQPTAVT